MDHVVNREASDLSKRVAAELRAAQARRKFTWTSIEEATGIPHITMYRMLSGKVDIPVAKLMLICEAAGLSVTDILDDAARHMPANYMQSLLVYPDVSEGSDNVTDIRDTDWDAYQGKKAADRDHDDDGSETRTP